MVLFRPLRRNFWFYTVRKHWVLTEVMILNLCSSASVNVMFLMDLVWIWSGFSDVCPRDSWCNDLSVIFLQCFKKSSISLSHPAVWCWLCGNPPLTGFRCLSLRDGARFSTLLPTHTLFSSLLSPSSFTTILFAPPPSLSPSIHPSRQPVWARHLLPSLPPHPPPPLLSFYSRIAKEKKTNILALITTKHRPFTRRASGASSALQQRIARLSDAEEW